MSTWWHVVVAVGGLLIASTAGAQVMDGRGNPYRQWDVAVGGTLHFDRERPSDRVNVYDVYNDSWRAGVAVQVDAGRYWNSHFKTEVSFAALNGHTDFGSDAVPVPGGIGVSYFETHIARKQVAAAVTYQFFENVFAHPYVSAGIRATLHDGHKVRPPIAYLPYALQGPATHQIPPFESRDREVFTRPYVAAGFKSYFNERTFIRSELSTAYAESGVRQWTLRLGMGVDF